MTVTHEDLDGLIDQAIKVTKTRSALAKRLKVKAAVLNGWIHDPAKISDEQLAALKAVAGEAKKKETKKKKAPAANQIIKAEVELGSVSLQRTGVSVAMVVQRDDVPLDLADTKLRNARLRVTLTAVDSDQAKLFPDGEPRELSSVADVRSLSVKADGTTLGCTLSFKVDDIDLRALERFRCRRVKLTAQRLGDAGVDPETGEHDDDAGMFGGEGE